MSLKQEIETWVAALAAYDNNEFDMSVRCFQQIADTSKILFNVGVIHATLGEHAEAVACYQRAVQLDQYLAVAYFQQGVSNFLMGDFEEALANFNDTLLYLRGNNNIDYEQLGLKFKLFSCEVLFNRGLCYIYLQQKDAGMQDLIFASREKMVPDHDVIDEAIKEQAEGYTVFSIPVGVVYRPNEAKVKNLKTKDYLGKARLVAAQDQQSTADPRRQAALAAMALDDRTSDKLSYAALNLVKPDLRSRARQQSEPPLRRHVFPPTPPPEPERPESAHGRQRSTDSGRSTPTGLSSTRPLVKPLRLELGAAAFDQSSSRASHPPKQPAHPHANEKARLGTKRSASERPAMRFEMISSRPHDSAPRRDRFRRASYRSDTSAPDIYIEPDPIEAYSQQAYASPPCTYQQTQSQSQQSPSEPHRSHTRTRSSAYRSQTLTISEEDETGTESTGGDSDRLSQHSYQYSDSDSSRHLNNHQNHYRNHNHQADQIVPLPYEILPPPTFISATNLNNHHHTQPHPSDDARSPPLSKIRVKVHGPTDTRFILIPPTTTFSCFEEMVEKKFSLSDRRAYNGEKGFKMKIRDDEGGLVTVGDGEDWEMAVGGCRAAAGVGGVETRAGPGVGDAGGIGGGTGAEAGAGVMGRMEIWVQEI